MAHNIFGDRFLGKREPAWHGLGQTFDAPIGAKEAIEASGLDYEIEMLPANVRFAGKNVYTGKHAIVRHPTPDDDEAAVLGLAGEDFGLLQNREIGDILDPLTERWPVETIGALGRGETMFLTLDAGSDKVGKEEVRRFFLFNETKDGRTAAKFAFTPVRVVCQNTLVAGLRAATLTATLPHHGEFEADLVWRTNLLYQLQDIQAQVMQSLGAMAEAQITAKNAKAIFSAAYPIPSIPQKVKLIEELKENGDEDEWVDLEKIEKLHEQAVARMEARREAANERFETMETEHRGTAWVAYNAVVEVEDFRGKETEGTLASALFGERARAKKRAFNEAMEYVQYGSK
jgi:phage/plasmid-like protein (TIGR03299 family)